MSFAFNPSVGDPTYCGWMQLLISYTGKGSIVDWANNVTAGASIALGFTGSAAPVPGRAMLLMIGALVFGARRRRWEAS
jgi:MYXO-CTERM domain-containing protein